MSLPRFDLDLSNMPWARGATVTIESGIESGIEFVSLPNLTNVIQAFKMEIDPQPWHEDEYRG
jgi:hypothetical protein